MGGASACPLPSFPAALLPRCPAALLWVLTAALFTSLLAAHPTPFRGCASCVARPASNRATVPASGMRLMLSSIAQEALCSLTPQFSSCFSLPQEESCPRALLCPVRSRTLAPTAPSPGIPTSPYCVFVPLRIPSPTSPLGSFLSSGCLPAHPPVEPTPVPSGISLALGAHRLGVSGYFGVYPS